MKQQFYRAKLLTAYANVKASRQQRLQEEIVVYTKSEELKFKKTYEFGYNIEERKPKWAELKCNFLKRVFWFTPNWIWIMIGVLATYLLKILEKFYLK